MKTESGVITNPETLRLIENLQSGRTPTIPITLEELDAIVKAVERGEPTEPLLSAIRQRAKRNHH